MRRLMFGMAAILAFASLEALAADFPAEFAYRDPTQNGGKMVVVQGMRDGSNPMATFCGPTGALCDCIFYRAPSDRNPAQTRSSAVSSALNTATCAMQRVSENLHEFGFLRLRNRHTSRVTRALPIRTSLTLAEVMGPSFSREKVAGVYRYSCARTFFEGEGVDPTSITCPANQHLGVISATYDFYTYRSGTGSNSGGGDMPFSSPICNRNSFLKTQCTNSTPSLRYGFYREQMGQFNVGIQMTRAPEAAPGDSNPLVELYGYAALPDSAGDCPVGLMKVRQWWAQPSSITQGSLGTNPPSNFVNMNSSLDNTVVEASEPESFQVLRQASSTPCSMNGDCTDATFGGMTMAQSVPYTAMTPVVCVIPPQLLNGIF